MFAANGVEVMIDAHDGYTPTPVISHAILTYNKGRDSGLADGVVITPSHNPPEDGGFKYNPPNGGPADTDITSGIERAANGFLEDVLRGVKRIPYDRARKSACVHRHDYIGPYVADLANVVDMEAIRGSGVKIGIDPLGGAGVRYWQPIIERYGLDATIVSDAVDPTFRFMTVDWDGKIRMDCSSPYAMARLIGMRDRFDVAFANDTDADRHGIVDPLERADEPEPLPRRRHRLSVREPSAMARGQRGRQDHRLQRDHRSRREKARPQAGRDPGRLQMVRRWPRSTARSASPARKAPAPRSCAGTASVWTTDKDGIILGLLAAEMTARDQIRSEPVVRQADERTGRAVLRADRRAGDVGAEESAEGAVARKARDDGTGRRAGSMRRSPRRPATVSRSAASR